jgi:hypothetical protein
MDGLTTVMKVNFLLIGWIAIPVKSCSGAFWRSHIDPEKWPKSNLKRSEIFDFPGGDGAEIYRKCF